MEVGMAFLDYSGRISSMDFHGTSSYLVTASDDESIRLYDVVNATCLKTINSKKYEVDLVSFTSHPTTVIYSSKNGWDESCLLACALKKSFFISGSLDRTVLLCDQRAEKCQGLPCVQGRPASASNILINTFQRQWQIAVEVWDPFLLINSGDGNVYAWSVRSGKEVASWMSTEAEPPVIKWAPGSLMFDTGSSEL